MHYIYLVLFDILVNQKVIHCYSIILAPVRTYELKHICWRWLNLELATNSTAFVDISREEAADVRLALLSFLEMFLLIPC